MTTTSWIIKALSININGMKTDMRQKLKSLQKQKADIYMLQETKLHSRQDIDNLKYTWRQLTRGEVYCYAAGANHSGGVAILLSYHAKLTLSNIRLHHPHLHSHRYLSIRAKLANNNVLIHSVYAPVDRNERPNFFNTLPTPSDEFDHLIGGDFNCAPHPYQDSSSTTDHFTCGSTQLLAWIATLGAADKWRQQFPERREYTSPAGKARIDIIFTSGIFNTVINSSIKGRISGSDHRAPAATMSSSSIENGKGHWQIPRWLIPRMRTKIQPVLDSFIANNQPSNYHHSFPKLMKQVSQLCKDEHKAALAQRRSRQQRAHARWLAAHITAINNPTPANISDAEHTRQQWITTEKEVTEAKKASEFDNHLMNAEACSKFFFAKNKIHNGTTIIPGVTTSAGETSTMREDIENSHLQFWRSVFNANTNPNDTPPTDQQRQQLLSHNIPQLTSSSSTHLDSPVTESEVRSAIINAPKMKAAGPDGLRAEIFHLHPDKWASILTHIYNAAMNGTQLGKNFRESIIILLYKKGSQLEPANYRPIALINIIAKILSSIHNYRLRKHLHSIIDRNQTGFVPGRSITENVLLVQDTLHWAKNNCPSAIVLCLDFAKAYDRVDWSFLKQSLTKTGFGPKWLTLINNIYNNRTAQLTINGRTTARFDITRGVLQGDPLSPALFIIQASPLYSLIAKLRTMCAIPLTINTTIPAGTFYADDSTLLAKSPEHAVQLFNAAQQFCTGSGARLNIQKCVAIPAGNAPTHLSNGIRILGRGETTSILGVPFGLDISREQQTNKVIKKMVERCAQWKYVGRTIQGRIIIARSIITSAAWYLLSALTTSKDEATKIQRLVNKFVHKNQDIQYDNTPTKANYSSKWFYLPKDKGGMGLTPISTTIACRKVSIIRDVIKRNEQSTPTWTCVMWHMCNKAMTAWAKRPEHIQFWKDAGIRLGIKENRLNDLTPWWQDAWMEWLQLNLRPKPNALAKTHLATWPIWNNRILANNHGLNTTLRRTANGSSSTNNYRRLRALGFLTFRDFMNNNLTFLTATALRNRVKQRMLRFPTTYNTIPQRTCTAIINRITTLWHHVIIKWARDPNTNIRTPQQHTTNDTVTWTDPKGKDFSTYTNRHINAAISNKCTTPPTPPTLKIDNSYITPDWIRERRVYTHLAPTRKDLLYRIVRNALPIGCKRVTWGADYQTLCPNCNASDIETAIHLFWECTYARRIWQQVKSPWKGAGNTNITWTDVVLGTDIKLNNSTDALHDKIWAIIRACTLRVIWLERNHRIFNPEVSGTEWKSRANQAALDIRAHLESVVRRTHGATKGKVNNIISHIKDANPRMKQLFTHNSLFDTMNQ